MPELKRRWCLQGCKRETDHRTLSKHDDYIVIACTECGVITEPVG